MAEPGDKSPFLQGEDLDLTVLRTQRFREPLVEEAFRRYHSARFASRPYVALYVAMQMVPLVLLGVMTAATGRGTRECPDRAFRYTESAYVVLLVAFWALSGLGIVGSVVPVGLAQGAMAAAHGVAIAVLIVLDHTLCHAAAPADTGFSVWLYPLGGSYVVVFANALLSAVPWPRSGVVAACTYLPVIGAFLYLVCALSTQFWYETLCCLQGIVAICIMGSLVSFEARGNYAAHVRLERERRQSAVDRRAADSIIQAMFPQDVACRLIETRVLPAARIAAVVDSVGAPLAEMLQEEEDSVPSLDPVFAKQSPSAVVVSVHLSGLDALGCAEKRLEAASMYLVSADGLAPHYGIEKVISYGDCILYASGLSLCVLLY
eukprot:m51a1_g4548 hypothetical protein (376) ;mRNA; r:66642-67873